MGNVTCPAQPSESVFEKFWPSCYGEEPEGRSPSGKRSFQPLTCQASAQTLAKSAERRQVQA